MNQGRAFAKASVGMKLTKLDTTTFMEILPRRCWKHWILNKTMRLMCVLSSFFDFAYINRFFE